MNYIFVLSFKGMFKIAIGKADFEVLDTTSVDEFIKNSKGVQVLKGKKLTGTWITCFSKQICDYEGKNFMIIGNLIVKFLFY